MRSIYIYIFTHTLTSHMHMHIHIYATYIHADTHDIADIAPIYTCTHAYTPNTYMHTHIYASHMCVRMYMTPMCAQTRPTHAFTHIYYSRFLGIGCRRHKMSCLGCKRRNMSCRCVMSVCHVGVSCRCVMPECFQICTLHINAPSTRPNTYIRTLYTHTHTHIRKQCIYSHAHSTSFLPISYTYSSMTAAIYSSIYAPYKCPACACTHIVYTCTHIVYTCTHIHALHVCVWTHI